jgi:hypothetical protein
MLGGFESGDHGRSSNPVAIRNMTGGRISAAKEKKKKEKRKTSCQTAGVSHKWYP